MDRQDSNYSKIVDKARSIASPDAKIYLFGSRARGDYRQDSDWDLLVIIDKPSIEEDDYEKYFYPFIDLSWNMGEVINPQLYTSSDWQESSFTPFYNNVEQDKILLA